MSDRHDCFRFEELQDRRLADEGVLTASEAAFLDEHATTCPDCGAEVAVIDAIQTGDAGRDGLSDEEVARRVSVVLQSREERQALRSRSSGTRARWIAVAGVAAAAALALVAWLRPGTENTESRRRVAANLSLPERLPAPTDARLTLVSGRVQVDARAAVVGQRLESGARLQVRRGRAVLRFRTGTLAVVEEGSQVEVRDPPGTEDRLVLKRGEALFRVTPHQPGRPFVVEAPWGRVEVLGTVFSVASGGNGPLVRVARGTVRVRRPGLPDLLVPAGRQLVAQARVAGASDQRQHQDLLDTVDSLRRLQAEADAVLDVKGTCAGTAHLDGVALGHLPVSLAVVPGSHELTVVHGGQIIWRKEVVLEKLERRTVHVGLRASAHADVPRPTPRPTVAAAPRPARRTPTLVQRPRAAAPAPRSPTPTVATAAELMKQAAAHRRAAKWAQAVTTYRELLRLHPASAEARTARVLIGQLLLWRLGQAAAALRAFETALRIAPAGSLAPEARWGRILALRSLGRRADERAACEEFLKRHGASLYAPKVRARLKELAGTK